MVTRDPVQGWSEGPRFVLMVDAPHCGAQGSSPIPALFSLRFASELSFAYQMRIPAAVGVTVMALLTQVVSPYSIPLRCSGATA
ncbi:hypothetical protein SAMN00790413_03368 [Deinococcus hopiensis KR-140]|uniref:Uncharacterized protein n=1 Tax=Deinococcus hopiensis KR-140 TaxID=695939 RepID=A0A1W1UW06_9DEIO|nr:hypothetical protein SAMN00790413_03368 [Deinococcus hopiensis KR-140]